MFSPEKGVRSLIAKLLSLSPQEGAVVALFKICRQDCFSCLYAHALRTVASICCVEEGINQLEKVAQAAVLTLCMITLLFMASEIEKSPEPSPGGKSGGDGDIAEQIIL